MQQGIGERKVSNSFHGQIFLASNTHKGSTFSVQVVSMEENTVMVTSLDKYSPGNLSN